MKKFAIFFSIFVSLAVSAFDDFLITDIRIIGLQRVSIGSIFTAIPVSVGDTMNKEKISENVVDCKSSAATFDKDELKEIFNFKNDKFCLTYKAEENLLDQYIENP